MSHLVIPKGSALITIPFVSASPVSFSILSCSLIHQLIRPRQSSDFDFHASSNHMFLSPSPELRRWVTCGKNDTVYRGGDVEHSFSSLEIC